jgi:hypothetical protein
MTDAVGTRTAFVDGFSERSFLSLTPGGGQDR